MLCFGEKKTNVHVLSGHLFMGLSTKTQMQDAEKKAEEAAATAKAEKVMMDQLKTLEAEVEKLRIQATKAERSA